MRSGASERGSVECAGGFSRWRQAREGEREPHGGGEEDVLSACAPLSVHLRLDLKLMSSLCRNEIFIAVRQLLAWEAIRGKNRAQPHPIPGHLHAKFAI